MSEFHTLQELARIERGDHGELRIEVTECSDDRGNASQFINIRLWYKPDGSDTMKPGKQGLTIRKNEIHAVGRALRAALDFMNERRAPRQPAESLPKAPCAPVTRQYAEEGEDISCGGLL